MCTSSWDSHCGCFSGIWRNGKSQGAWYYIDDLHTLTYICIYICICICTVFCLNKNILDVRYIKCKHRVETTILVVSPGSGGMAKAKARETILNVYTLLYNMFVYVYVSFSVYMFIPDLLCIHRVQITILVVSPGSGGMAKAKAHDTILYVKYTVVYINVYM